MWTHSTQMWVPPLDAITKRKKHHTQYVNKVHYCSPSLALSLSFSSTFWVFLFVSFNKKKLQRKHIPCNSEKTAFIFKVKESARSCKAKLNALTHTRGRMKEHAWYISLSYVAYSPISKKYTTVIKYHSFSKQRALKRQRV